MTKIVSVTAIASSAKVGQRFMINTCILTYIVLQTVAEVLVPA
jgi:hypothetical protein